MKKERATTSDEQRERMLIAEQIERAAVEKGSESPDTTPPVEEGLKRDETTEKVVLSFAPKAITTSSSTTSISLSKPIGGLKLNPLKASNPLKRPNVFKQAPAKKSTSPPIEVGKKRDASEMTAAGKLMEEDLERKRRRLERDAVAA